MNAGLDTVDWVVIALYFAGVAAVALRVSGGQRDTRDYFLGGRSLPWWASSLSIVATETSAVTFIGVPAAAYSGDWSLLELVAGFILGRIILAAFFVRLFYATEHETVYGFLGTRFGGAARTLASTLFLCGRVVGSGVRLLAGCLALGVALGSGADPAGATAIQIAIVAVGVFGTAFTLIGGIRAVVWTDVILGVTLVLAAGVSAAYMLGHLSPSPTGPTGVAFDAGAFAERTRVVHLSFDLADGRSLLAGILGGFFLTLATHGTDQDIAQRMLTCRNSRLGSLSVIGSAVLIVPLFTLFLAVGTLLWFYYAQRPPAYPIATGNTIFPLFIVHELPAGVSGFVIAGLLAASLSSLTSVLNALSATTICDLYRPWRERRSPAGPASASHYLKVSRAATLGWGAVLIVVALAFLRTQQNILDLALGVLTYFYGGLLGAFLVGVFTRRGTSLSVSAGMLASVPVVLLLQLRRFIDAPEKAPGFLQEPIRAFAETWGDTLRGTVPDLSWHYWTIVGAAVAFTIGVSRRRPSEP